MKYEIVFKFAKAMAFSYVLSAMDASYIKKIIEEHVQAQSKNRAQFCLEPKQSSVLNLSVI